MFKPKEWGVPDNGQQSKPPAEPPSKPALESKESKSAEKKQNRLKTPKPEPIISQETVKALKKDIDAIRAEVQAMKNQFESSSMNINTSINTSVSTVEIARIKAALELIANSNAKRGKTMIDNIEFVRRFIDKMFPTT
jgi:hypothetical protein